jgi:hypothetical protein
MGAAGAAGLAWRLEREGLAPAGAVRRPLDYPRRRPALERGRLRRDRRWPGEQAEALVRPGDTVAAPDIVARYTRAGRASVVDLAALLGAPPERAWGALQRQQGDLVAEGDVLAERRALGGLQRRALRSPVTGRVSYVSPDSAAVFVEPLPVEVQVGAHLGGTVVEVGPGRVTIEGEALAIAGLAGAGPAAAGILVVANSPEAIPAEAAGTIVACAFPVDEAAVRAAADAGAAAIVAAGIDEAALERLGWDDVLWPHPTARSRTGAGGPPAPPLTVVLFGVAPTPPPPEVWDALRALAGRPASALGAEPGAGAELLVPLDDGAAARASSGVLAADSPPAAIEPGARVRAIAGRADGLTGRVVEVVEAPYRLPSEVTASVAVVDLPYDVRLRLPLLHLQRLP